MRILAIDSSAVTASVAVVDNGKLTGEFFLNTGLTHSRTLMSMLESVLSCADISLSDIDLFAVTNGPGSFTGIRIGVASIMGMAEALGKPCVGVSTLLSMAYNMKNSGAYICSVMDARCNQVYTALFKSDSDKIQRIYDDDAISIEELFERLCTLDGRIILVGDGARLCFDKLKDRLPLLCLPEENLIYQRAFGVAAAVADNRLYESADTADKLTVSYLRLSQAERERNAKLEVNKK